MDMTCTLSSEFLGSPSNFNKLTSLLSWTLEFTSMIQVSQQYLLKCEGDFDDFLHRSRHWYQTLIPAVLILLTSKVSNQDFSCLFSHLIIGLVIILFFISPFLQSDCYFAEFLSQSGNNCCVIVSSSWEWSSGESGLQNNSQINISIHAYLCNIKYICISKCHTKA